MENELLDFCRAKKLFDKGFGFLSSINYPKDVFFHFSKINDAEIREELEKLKRGVVYIYYTSKEKENKRKVSRIWLSLKYVPDYLIPDFKLKIIDELNDGKTNVFELAYIIKELKSLNYIDRSDFKLILYSNKIQSNPSVIIHMLSDKELEKFQDVQMYFNDIRTQENNNWTTEILTKIFD